MNGFTNPPKETPSIIQRDHCPNNYFWTIERKRTSNTFDGDMVRGQNPTSPQAKSATISQEESPSYDATIPKPVTPATDRKAGNPNKNKILRYFFT